MNTVLYLRCIAIKSLQALLPAIMSIMTLHSQSIDSAMKYMDTGQYKKACMQFEKVLPLIEKAYGPTDTAYYSYMLFYAAVASERCMQYADAENVLMSLWKIPDYETSVLMKIFNMKLFSGISLHIAFKKAQDQMKAKYPDEPYLWAGFVLML